MAIYGRYDFNEGIFQQTVWDRNNMWTGARMPLIIASASTEAACQAAMAFGCKGPDSSPTHTSVYYSVPRPGSIMASTEMLLGFQIRAGSSNEVSIICSPGLNRVNWNPKFWVGQIGACEKWPYMESMTSMKASSSKLCEIGTTCGRERGCHWLLPVPARRLPARLPWPLVAKALPVRPLILTLTTLQLGGGFHEAHVLRFEKISLRLFVCLFVYSTKWLEVNITGEKGINNICQSSNRIFRSIVQE